MIFSIAWKNVWRNKLRSLIIILSITIGLLGGIFYLAFVNGMIQQQVYASIHSEISNVQLHNPKYLINDEVKFTIAESEEKIEKIESLDKVEAVSSRIKSPAMVSSAITGTGITISGIDYEEEKKVTDIQTKLIDGTYFDTKLRNPTVIGEKLADKLKVKIKSKIVITIQNSAGEISYGAFRVAGIYKTDNTNFDQANVFVLKENLGDLIGIDKSNATEIAVLLKHNDFTDSAAVEIRKIFTEEISSNELTVRSWKEIQPALKMMNDMTIQFSMIFVIIILVALSFGIMNTMLMAIMERVREIGMLMAIGMNRIKVFFMIMLETIFLSITGGIIGISVTWIVVEMTGKSGIDLSAVAEGLNAWGYSSFIYPELDAGYYFMIGLLVIVTAIFSSILPARKALKLNPAEAVRHDV